MAKGRRRIRIFLKVILAIAIPVIMLALAFYGLGAYLRQNDDKILPGTTIDGVDVSWLTRDEAMQAINLQEYDARGNGAEVSIEFPDGSALRVTGEDVRLRNNARALVDLAYASGRGYGFVEDTINFTWRIRDLYTGEAEPEDLKVVYELDIEFLRARVNVYTWSYNSELGRSMPLIYEDRVVVVKGAGQVCASELEVYELALGGLLESLAAGRPVEVSYALPDAGANTAELMAIRRSLYAQPLTAEYDPETKTVSESAVGVDFDFDGAVALLDGTESGKAVTFDVEYTQPEVTQEYLEGLLFRDLICECTTKIPGTADRLNNIVLASQAVNGTVLEPGEEFSFNRIVGRRSPSRGFKLAPAYSGGQTVQAYGGGICQVSSTVYSAVKDTDIRVTERHAHGRPVAYLPRGRDATVSWGTLDFRFVNNTDYPLRIDAAVDGRTLTVKVYGTTLSEEADDEDAATAAIAVRAAPIIKDEV